MSLEKPTRLIYIPWTRWDAYRGKLEGIRHYNTENDNPRRPQWFTISPNGDMHLSPIPDKPYQIQWYSPKAVQELTEDADEPFMPEIYHDMIVWRAIRDYALYMQDAAMAEKARLRYNPLKQHLDMNELPEVTLATGQFYHTGNYNFTY